MIILKRELREKEVIFIHPNLSNYKSLIEERLHVEGYRENENLKVSSTQKAKSHPINIYNTK